MSNKNPLVSVVIPTRNRPELISRALHGVFNQTLTDIEVIVVLDGPDETTLQVLNKMADPRLRVIRLPKQSGPPTARNAGIVASRSKWLTFLDDDDEWMPSKLEMQLESAKRSKDPYPVISCKVVSRSENGDCVWPRRVPRPKEPLSEYLFCRKSLFFGESFLQTSTIFTKRALLLQVPFRTDLKINEDLDWLIRASNIRGVSIEFVPVPLVILHNEITRSRLSNSPDWRYSLAWIQSNVDLVTPNAYRSFIMTWLSSDAARQGDWKAFYFLIREALKHGKPSLIDTIIYFGNWVIPRSLRSRAAALFGY